MIKKYDNPIYFNIDEWWIVYDWKEIIREEFVF